MNKHTIPLGRIFGIPIGLDWSWFLIFALVTWTLAIAYFPSQTTVPAAVDWILGALTALFFFASVILHELGHSAIALWFKVPVRRITLFIFGGVAEIAQEPPSAGAEFFIAMAGPLVSFALAGLFGVVAASSTAFAPILAIATYLTFINGSLGLFNLIPGFPLDGGRVFRAIVWRITGNLNRATRLAANLGRIIALGLIVFGIWQVFRGNPGGWWITFLGWFLASTAGAELDQLNLQELLARQWEIEALNHNYVVIPAASTLQQVVDQHLSNIAARTFAVQGAGTILGWLTWYDINAVPRAQWQTLTVEQTMKAASTLEPVHHDTGLIASIEIDQVNEPPVASNVRPARIFNHKDILNFLRQHKWLRV